MLKEQDYSEYCRKYNSIYKYLKQHSVNQTNVAKKICDMRGYYPERMMDTLIRAGFIYLDDSSCTEKLKIFGDDYGLFSSNDTFLLDGRYIFPVKDMLGNVIALVGWYPDEKKYITTPSRFFSKACLFYGMEQIGRSGIGKPYVLVEGIFDSLSVRSLGVNCVAQMGISNSRYKSIMYSMFSKLLAIPDNDVEGRGVILNDEWSLPSRSSYFRWIGDSSKDIDDFCNSYEAEDVKELLLESFKDTRRVVTYRA